jgi:hypothetical protein
VSWFLGQCVFTDLRILYVIIMFWYVTDASATNLGLSCNPRAKDMHVSFQASAAGVVPVIVFTPCTIVYSDSSKEHAAFISRAIEVDSRG